MTKSSTKPSTSKFLHLRFLGTAAAILLMGASAQAQLSPGEKQIEKKLVPAGTKLKAATDAQILAATPLAIANPTNTNVTTSEIVAAAMLYIPQNATVVLTDGLNKVKFGTLSANKKATQVQAIVKNVMTKSLKGVDNQLEPSPDAAARAAAITAAATDVLKDLPTKDTLFKTAIKAAVGAGISFRKGSKNGAAGAVTGAIAAAAGVSNDNLAPGTTAGDALVTLIIRTAAKKAPSRALEIAEASGYAFAGAYRGTTSDSSEINLTQFIANNGADILVALSQGLPENKFNKLRVQLTDRIQAGIALAYGNVATDGSTGVNGFAYNNGVLSPVTDIAGL